jgi:16S rRNA (adenine1518-N6/adenine1519-N6)-dimethyltransferase
LIHHDFLTCDFSRLPAFTKTIGNIPYNISTPIIEKLIALRQQCPLVFLTVQLDFAERLIAKSGTKDYGALTCFIQYYADTEILFNISSAAFSPRPKVTSAFIRVRFGDFPVRAVNEKLLFKLTQAALGQRRKKMINALSSLISKEITEEILEKLDVPKNIRGEDLKLEQFVAFSILFAVGSRFQPENQ